MKVYRKAPDWYAKACKLNKKETDYERKYICLLYTSRDFITILSLKIKDKCIY